MIETVILYPDGFVKERGCIDKQGRRQKEWVFFDTQRRKTLASTYLNDVLYGPCTEFLPVKGKGSYMQGKKEGIWKRFDAKDKVVEEHHYTQGVLTKHVEYKSKNNTITTFYEHGQVVARQLGENGPIQRTLHPTNLFCKKKPEIPKVLEILRAGGYTAIARPLEKDYECSISLEPIEGDYFTCTHPEMKHYFDAESLITYAKMSDTLGYICPIDRYYEMDPRRFQNYCEN